MTECLDDFSLMVVGAGSLGRMVGSLLHDQGEHSADSVLFVDDAPGPDGHLFGSPVRSGVRRYLSFAQRSRLPTVIAIASNRVREELVTEFPDVHYTSLIHPSAVVSRFATVGRGSIILPNVSIDPDAILGEHVIVNKNVSLGHNASLGSFAQVSPGSSLGGPIGVAAFIGLGSVVLPGVAVGDRSVIGAGSVVTKPIPAGVVAVGAPCTVIRKN